MFSSLVYSTKKGVIEFREVYGVYRWIDSGDGEFGVLGCGGGAALVDDLQYAAIQGAEGVN